MSSKEKQAKRQAKRRLKIKESDEAYQSYVKKDRERKKAQRSASKAAMTTSQLDEHRMKERQRVREYRQRRKESQPIEISSPISTPYSTTQARGKAIKHASLALPLSPRKKHCVVRSIAESIGLQVNVSLCPHPKVMVHLVRKQSNLSMLFTTAMILPGRLLGAKIESLSEKQLVMGKKSKERSSCDTC